MVPVQDVSPAGGEGHSNVLPGLFGLPSARSLTAQLTPTLLENRRPLILGTHTQMTQLPAASTNNMKYIETN